MEEFRELTSGCKIEKYYYPGAKPLYSYWVSYLRNKDVHSLLISFEGKISEISVESYVILHQEQFPEMNCFYFKFPNSIIPYENELYVRFNSDLSEGLLTVYAAINN